MTADGVVTVKSGTDLTRALARTADLVESALDVLLPIPEGAEARLAEAMRYATLGGGKRLRAFLVMQSSSLFSVAETCAARVASSVEMLHAYSLVHDDLPAMDDDDLRRGMPTCHVKYGDDVAILAGDAVQAETLARRHISQAAEVMLERLHQHAGAPPA